VNSILVGNLSPTMTETELRSIFEQYGSVQRFTLMTNLKTDLPRGFAFLQMKSDAEAMRAIAEADGREIDGRRITVSATRPQIHRQKK
jgi:RNA recognition motif-containing protein